MAHARCRGEIAMAERHRRYAEALRGIERGPCERGCLADLDQVRCLPLDQPRRTAPPQQHAAAAGQRHPAAIDQVGACGCAVERRDDRVAPADLADEPVALRQQVAPDGGVAPVRRAVDDMRARRIVVGEVRHGV
jgi:hypothetical protein